MYIAGDLIRGHTETIILARLMQRDSYGYEINKTVRELSGGRYELKERPNVFVSGIKDSVARHVINYLLEKCPEQSGLMIFQRIPNPPGYKLYGMGEPKRQLIELSGLQLVSEKDDVSILF